MSKPYVITNKNLMQEWNWEKNYTLGLLPNNITLGSDQKVWWTCKKCNYVWFASVGHRNQGRGCPKCANKLRMKSRVSHYGSLLDKNPELCKEWDYEKNSIKPSEILPGSGKKVWWICKRCGHHWQASITNRNSKSNKNQCPKCSLIYQTSIAEKIVCYYVAKVFPNIQENIRLPLLNNRELDIFIPQYNIAIEYDGRAWHKNVNLDIEKDFLCKQNNISLIRIREKTCPQFENSSIIIWTDVPNNSYIQLNEPIQQCINHLIQISGIDKTINVNIADDYDTILGTINQKSLMNSIANSPLLEEWDYDLNKIQPQYISIHSNKKVWWKCKTCGYSWRVSVNNRSSGNRCPYCSRKIVKPGFNDLATTNPELLIEWDYEKNTISPNEIIAGSDKKVWWKCENYGHSWEASPNTRRNQKTKCPYCSNKKILQGFNDLATTNPELLIEWDYVKNNIKPTEITAGSNKKVWWICKKCKYEWQTATNNRASGKKTACPKCAHKYIGQINSIKRRKTYQQSKTTHFI